MARSNLNISTLLTEAFLTAQQFSNGTRCIKVLIEGENLILSTITRRVGNAEADFDQLASTVLKENGATILLFCLSDQDAEKLNWLLLPFIPDHCKVREKMLYSSSRDDLKRALGVGFFSQDYAANTLSEVTWELLKSYLSNDRKEEYLSEKERMVRDEKILSHAESVFTKSTAMGVLPFSMTRELVDSLQKLTGSTEFNLIEMSIIDEDIRQIARFLTDGTNMHQYVNQEEPRFLALSLLNQSSGAKVSYLIFSCPESAPVRKKMIMSSAKDISRRVLCMMNCSSYGSPDFPIFSLLINVYFYYHSKATLLALAAEHGLVFDRTLEIHSPEEIDEQTKQDMSTGDLIANSSAAANIVHSKPQRPGRGKGTRTVSKFSADSSS